MGRKNPSLRHELIKRVLPQIENNLTGTAYKKHIKKFASWARENGYRKLEDITKETIQEYEKHLENAPKKYTPATIHTYLSPVCSAAGIRMEEIKKPRRTAGSISRGRDRDVTGKKVVKNKHYYWQRRVRKKAVQTAPAALLPSSPREEAQVSFAEISFSQQTQTSSCAAPDPVSDFHPEAVIRRGDLVIGLKNSISDRLLDRILEGVSHAV